MYRRSDDNTKWIKNKEAKKPPRPDTTISINGMLQPFMAEGKGDLTLAILMAVRNILRTPDRWCRAHRALGPGGQQTETTSGHAERWSMFGALDAVTSGGLEKLKPEIIGKWKRHLPQDERSLTVWEADDSRRHGEVLRVLNMAIGTRKTEIGK
jgi:hypothetical protein